MKINKEEVAKALMTLKDGGEPFELRVICDRKTNWSGYFNDIDTAISRLEKLDAQGNVYFTLNPLLDACLSRKQYNTFVRNVSPTTQDKEVLGYEWLFIDFDPERIADVSATDEEVKSAAEVCVDVYNFLRDKGFENPVISYSGNGCHLLYRVGMTIDSEPIVKKFLTVISGMFSTSKVKIDTVNYNPSRICKLYGTLAVKGTNTKERPHRYARMVKVPDPVKRTDIRYIKKVCDLVPDIPKPKSRYIKSFNLKEWLDTNGLAYREENGQTFTKYVLDHCPFDESHTGKDACIFESADGIGFHCFHNSCADKTWKDVRLLFEPDAYDWKETEKQIYTRNAEIKRTPIKPSDSYWLDPVQILKMPREKAEYVKTGTTMIDRKMLGLKKKAISVVSGLRSSGKSTWLNQLAINACNEGCRVGLFSGESTVQNTLYWIMRQAAGRNELQYGGHEGVWNPPSMIQEKIAQWLQPNLMVYYHEAYNDSRNFDKLKSQILGVIESRRTDLVIIDNLMTLNLKELDPNKWDAQSRFVLDLATTAKEKNCHILFVAHPRKPQGFLRLDDISGSADLANAVDDAFIVHRVNNDFVRLTKEMFRWDDDNPIYEATNVIEVCKDRENGTQDLFIPLWYEEETKRLRNDPTEYKHYRWEKGYE